ncbi:MAG: phage baseplate assembly protein, partial [Baekduiaceae bacterium]
MGGDPRGLKKHRDRMHPMALKLRGLVRRVIVAATGVDGLWKLLGFEAEDGAREGFEGVEVFPGIGFASRPGSGGKPEVVILNIGADAGHPVVVASRDRSLEVELDEDETAVFNSQAVIKFKKDGTVEIRGRDGDAVGVVHADGIDPFTGATYGALGNPSARGKVGEDKP